MRIGPKDAAELVNALAASLSLSGFETRDYRKLITNAPAQGIRGGAIYDALHAESARLAGCAEIHTLNVSHFRHVAPDLNVVPL